MASLLPWSANTTKPPRAIVHIDGDAFFASCEQALHPAYRGQPVITGAERHIVACASYEAKRYGVQRGIPLWQAKQLCPPAIIVPSDYESYSLFSTRLSEILHRFTPLVEDYSIDEVFADITGVHKPAQQSYPQLAYAIKQQLQHELGLTFSVGLAVTKVLAKVGSIWNKPNGFTVLSRDTRTQYLSRLPVGKIWGIGPHTTAYLQTQGITTAGEFAQQSSSWVKRHCAKPYYAIWQELRGDSVLPVQTEPPSNYQSISKTKTFTPPSSQPSYVFAQLSKNIESAFIKLRRHHLVTQRLLIYLKTQKFRYYSLEITLNRATAFPHEVLPLAHSSFRQLFNPNTWYRATGVVLCQLHSQTTIQLNLFESPIQVKRCEKIYQAIDQLAQRYGKHTVFLGSSLPVQQQPDQRQQQRQLTSTYHHTTRKYIGLPVLQLAI